MKRRMPLLALIGLLAPLWAGCAVISRQRMSEALTEVTFPQLRQHLDRYNGQTVILGGHVIEVRNQDEQTILVVLQSPLGYGQEPQPPERSQGRFMLRQEGFLDPEVYTKGRTLTAAGRVIGKTRETIGQEPYTYPLLEALEIHLWPTREELYPYRPYDWPPFYDPWYPRHHWRGYPYGYRYW